MVLAGVGLTAIENTCSGRLMLPLQTQSPLVFVLLRIFVQNALLLLNFFVAFTDHLIHPLYLPFERRVEIVLDVVVTALFETSTFQ